MKKGFSIIELMIVISVLGVIATIGVPAYSSIRSNIILKNDVYSLVGNIRLAQNLSLISQDGKKHGIYFESEKYYLYSGNDFANADKKQIFNFMPGISVQSGVGKDISFERLTGTTASSSLSIGINSSDLKNIRIDRNGKIEVN